MKNKFIIIPFIAILLLGALSLSAQATSSKIYWRSGIIGGTIADLDAIPVTTPLATGDVTLVVSSSSFYVYRYDSTSSTTPSTPNVVKPTTATTGRWILQNGNFSSLTVGSIDIPINNGTTGEVQLQEDPANGTNVVGFKAPATVSANLLYVLPATDGSSGQCLKTNGSGVLYFASCP